MSIHPNATKEIDKAFEQFTGFQRKFCDHLRELIHKALPEVVEDWKSGPAFHLEGLVCSVLGLKKEVKLVFFKGSLMKDKYELFNDGDDIHGNRNILFTEHSVIDDAMITEYLKEAAALNKDGVKLEKKSGVTVPAELLKALSSNKGLKMYFDRMAPSHKREYADYIADAKQDETKERRIKKVIEMIIENRKMHEKYELKNKYKRK